MSVVSTIYANLAAVSVKVGSTNIEPTVYELDELPENIATAHLPCRLLLPLGGDPTEGRDGEFIAIGTGVTVNWQISDLMLWQSSEQGIGLREYAPTLVEYCGKYVDAMRAFRCPATNTALESFSVTPGEYEWPRGSGRFYAGVLCRLNIKEVLSG